MFSRNQQWRFFLSVHTPKLLFTTINQVDFYNTPTEPHQQNQEDTMADPRILYKDDVDFATLALQSPAFNKL